MNNFMVRRFDFFKSWFELYFLRNLIQCRYFRLLGFWNKFTIFSFESFLLTDRKASFIFGLFLRPLSDQVELEEIDHSLRFAFRYFSFILLFSTVVSSCVSQHSTTLIWDLWQLKVFLTIKMSVVDDLRCIQPLFYPIGKNNLIESKTHSENERILPILDVLREGLQIAYSGFTFLFAFYLNTKIFSLFFYLHKHVLNFFWH